MKLFFPYVKVVGYRQFQQMGRGACNLGPKTQVLSTCRNVSCLKAFLPSAYHHLFNESDFYLKSKESDCFTKAFVLVSALPKFPKLNWETQSWVTLEEQSTRNKI